ncbi:YheC/YheD family protein [Alteribacter keqinensis]|uniref:YheC/D like ATP-grasp n=1 Tax=Alteribacter keqinensis TaxID=2483800 RepID=A0A3M7TMV4_9BACI|nr:YheC/YheD family protein [Alteribacter keqinensis]RNA66718.1 hypothetical protein EBO34_16005 [Alteribacter keqinensis]
MPKVIIDNSIQEPTLIMNEKTLFLHQFSLDSTIVHLGASKVRYRIDINNSLKSGVIRVSPYFSEKIQIPTLPFDSYVSNKELFIGPVIGFIPSRYFYNNPQRLKERFTDYEHVKGLIYFFNKKNINFHKQVIHGYYYNSAEDVFTEGTFPLPSVLYTRVKLSKQEFVYFNHFLKGKLFNYTPSPITKDSLQKIIPLPSSRLRTHLPHTIKYNGGRSIKRMLTKYSGVYVKPVNLSRGRGIHYVCKKNTGYQVYDTNGKSAYLKNTKALTALFKRNKHKHLLVQQAIDTIFKGHRLDFRVYMQKNSEHVWQASAITGKVADKRVIVTNYPYRKNIVTGEEALSFYYSLPQSEASAKLKEAEVLCRELLILFERKKNFFLGDVAVDLAVDNKMKIWLLEVQVRYVADIKKPLPDDESIISKNILPTPFHYAKSLTEF